MVGGPPTQLCRGFRMKRIGQNGVRPAQGFPVRSQYGQTRFNQSGDPLPNFKGCQRIRWAGQSHGGIHMGEPSVDHLNSAAAKRQLRDIPIHAQTIRRCAKGGFAPAVKGCILRQFRRYNRPKLIQRHVLVIVRHGSVFPARR